jgi:serine phosphatase RsbU (regulator of sigma subunit)
MGISMPEFVNSRKSTWNLAGRTLIICLAFLVVPLFIHSFLQYRKELKLEEQERAAQEAEARAAMRLVGWQMSQQIGEMLTTDWKLLDVPSSSALAQAFQIQTIPVQGEMGAQFAYIEDGKLWVGKKVGESAQVIAHPVDPILNMQGAPFGIKATFEMPTGDLPSEKVRIANTNLVLTLTADPGTYVGLHVREFYLRIASFIVLVGLLGGGLVFLLLQKLAKPLEELVLTMERVSEGQVERRYANQPWGFEFNSIGSYFNHMLDRMLVHQQEAAKERGEREKLSEKFRIAAEIQQSLLPEKFPTISHLGIEAVCMPALEVGGDFYDIFPIDQDKTLIVIADVADKGISACLYSLGLRSSIRALSDYDLATIARRANELFAIDAEKTSEFATLWIGILEGRVLHYFSFGHPAAFLERGGHLSELESGHPALGVEDLKLISPKGMKLESGDRLLLYSDGAVEAQTAQGAFYGVDRLKKSFLKGKSLNGILADIHQFSQGAPQQDDLTLVKIEIL